MSRSKKNARTAGDNRVLTIYQGGFAKVEETRAFRLAAGDNDIQIDGMPQQYMRNSLLILGIIGDGDVTVDSADFRTANNHPQQVLALAEGASVNIKFRSSSGRQRFAEGTLLKALGDKLFIEKSTGKTSMVNVGDIEELEFTDGLPEGVSDTCYLLIKASATTGGAYKARLLYRTGGLNWAANHSAIYDEAKGFITKLESWVTLSNGSGVDSNDVKVKLLSGDIAPQQDAYAESAMAPQAFAAAAGGSPKRANLRRAQTESVGEQKLYTLPRKVGLPNGASPQVPLFSSEEIPVTREYFLPAVAAWQRQNQANGLKAVSIRLKCVNDAEHKLGTALPAGDVSIYQVDSEGDTQLTGSTAIDHVAVGEAFGFVIGTSTDIKAERKLVSSEEVVPEAPAGDRKHTQGGPDVGKPGGRRGARVVQPVEPDEDAPKYHDETWEITVHNFKSDREVEVVVMEEFPDKHEVRESTHTFAKEAGSRFAASVKVGKGEKTVLRYVLRVQD